MLLEVIQLVDGTELPEVIARLHLRYPMSRKDLPPYQRKLRR